MTRNRRPTAALLVLAVLGGIALPGTVEAARKVYFNAFAYRDCYISVFNPGKKPLRLDWNVTGGDGTLDSWTLAFARLGGSKGFTIAKNGADNLPAGGTVLLAYTKTYNRPGMINGYLSIGENTGAAVATGVCFSKEGADISFDIMGGQAF